MAIENVESEKDTTSAVLLEAGRMVDPNVSLEVPTTKAAADIPPGAGSDNNKNHDEPTKAKTAKKKFVPGSLLLTSLEASGLSDGLKGISSEQVNMADHHHALNAAPTTQVKAFRWERFLLSIASETS